MSKDNHHKTEKTHSFKSNDFLSQHQAPRDTSETLAFQNRQQSRGSEITPTSIAKIGTGGRCGPPALTALLRETSRGGLLEHIRFRERSPFNPSKEAEGYIQNLVSTISDSNIEHVVTELERFSLSSGCGVQSISNQGYTLKALIRAVLEDFSNAKKLSLQCEIDRYIHKRNLPTALFLAFESLCEERSVKPHILLQNLLCSSTKKDKTKRNYLHVFTPDQVVSVASAVVQSYRSEESVVILLQILDQVIENCEREKTPLNQELLQSVLILLQTNQYVLQDIERQTQSGTIIQKLHTMNSPYSFSTADGHSSPSLLLSSENSGEQITNFLSDLGAACTANANTLRETLSEVANSVTNTGTSTLDEAAISRIIWFFANKGCITSPETDSLSAALVSTLLPSSSTTSDNFSTLWNLDAVSQVLSEDYSHLDWVLIARKFDFSDFDVRDFNHMQAILKLYRSGANTNPPNYSTLCKWRNQTGQLSLMEQLIVSPPDIFTFVVNSEEKADAATAVDRCANNAWACAELLRRLLALLDVQPLSRRVRDLFIKALLTCPEVLLCSLVRLQLNMTNDISNNERQVASKGLQMIMRELIPLFFKPNIHHAVKDPQAAIRRLWSISPNTVATACIEVWRSSSSDTEPSRLATALHLIDIIRLIPNSAATILNSNKDFEFSIAIAFVMKDNELHQLSPWLTERGNSVGLVFPATLTAYLWKTYDAALPRRNSETNRNGEAALVTIENVMTSLQYLHSLDRSILSKSIPSGTIRGDNSGNNVVLADSVKALADAFLTRHPSFKPVTQSDASVSSINSNVTSNADDIEEKANSYFQKIYTSEQSIDEVIEMLKRFKVSGDPTENDIFACMIHNLFDEYRFFSKYPEKELRITGILFGALIQHQLVTSITLGIALRYVLEALRKPPGNGTTSSSGKMFRFGMFALEQFKTRLHEWPQYCSHIVQIKYLKKGYADLVAEIEGAMVESQSKGSVASNNSNSASGDNSTTVSGRNTPVGEKLEEGPFVQKPPNNVIGTAVPNGDTTSFPPSLESLIPPSKGNLKQTLSNGIPSVPMGGNTSAFKTNQPTIPTPGGIVLIPPSLPLPAKNYHNPTARTVAVFGPGLGRAVNDQKEPEAQNDPPESVSDRVQFLINNVSHSNADQKSKEVKDILAPEYFGWLGHYLVVKRISTQPNFHSAYLAFLDKLGDYGRGLVEAILNSVYLNVGKLLRSPKITTSTSERSLLKNLGSWLGQITLARNRPILQIMLDCKELLFQGYETGMLIAVTPFVAKILEGAKNSNVFRPPNPWLMGLLSVFRALYGVDDLKMNIKFEVEVLCKNLGVKLEDIPLRTEDLAKRIPPLKERNPDFNIKSSVVSQASSAAPGGNVQNSANTGPIPPSPDGKALVVPVPTSTPNASSSDARQANNVVTAVPAPSNSSQGTASFDQQQTVIPNLAAYVTINASLAHLFQQPHGMPSTNINGAVLKRAVPIAVDRAIREIIQPVVERSVTIACITTKEIVTKDFAMESDENKMRKAAQLMVANLAGSLALVTCREPLRASVSTHLRQLLLSNGNAQSGNSTPPNLTEHEQQAVDQCVNTCATDNLELGCMLIEKAATEKAVRDMDESLAPALQARRKHREQTGQPYYDMSIFGSGSNRYPSALPEPLRPKPCGLRSEQLLVYETFQRMPRQPVAPGQNQAPVAGPPGNVASPGASAPMQTGPSPSTGSQSRLPPNANVTPNPVSKGGAVGSNLPQQQIGLEALSTIASKLDSAVTNLLSSVRPRAPEITLAMIPPDHEVRQLLMAVQRVGIVGGSRRVLNNAETDAVLGFAQNVFKRLYELSLSEPLRLEALVALLEGLNEFCSQLGQDLGTWATYAPTETEAQRKLHRTILLLLVRSRLIPVIEVDSYLARCMEGGRNSVWVEFSLLFVRTAVLERICAADEMPKVLEVLTKIAEGGGSGRNDQSQLKPIRRLLGLDEARSTGGQEQRQTVHNIIGETPTIAQESRAIPTHQQSISIGPVSLASLAEGTKKASEAVDLMSRNDPPGMRQQVTFLLDSWIRVHSEAPGSEKALAQYLQLLQQHGVGKSDEITERFFRVSTELVVEAVLKSASSESSMKSTDGKGNGLNYSVIDAYAKLVVLLIRYMNTGGTSEQVATQRISLLNKVLGITVRTLMSSYECTKQQAKSITPQWDQRPWFRLLLNLVTDLNSPSPALDPISFGILSIFGSAFHVIQPLVVPGFAFAWLELVSHRMFLSNLLLLKRQKGWGIAHQLFIDIFLFLEPHLRRTELTDAIKHLYKGTLRVLLVLLHDFPSFLAGYHLSFCNVIPENCVQLRNLILSTFPKGMVLPDPFTPNLKIDRLPEISRSPVILSNVAGPLGAIRSDLDGYLKSRQPVNFISGLLSRLYKDGMNDVDAPRVNSLVLYVGIQAISRLQNSQSAPQIAHTPEMEVLQKLMDFDDRGRYIALNAIANQLRYPSSHTHYFSCVMLFLFSEAKDEGVREQVTRVLLERLIVHRPHPWGLLITFIELIKNQRYQFWSHSFTRCATEIEKVFESVARSCMTPESQRSVTAGGDEPQ